MSDVVLITGGLGYVGGRLAQALEEQSSFSLRLGTRRPEQRPPSALKKSVLVPFDLEADDTVRTACQGVRYVIHLAALNEIDSLRSPEEAVNINTLGTLRVLHSAIAAGVERFIFFSTAHVYKAPLAGLITEETLPRPVHPYAITHKAAEDFVLAAHSQKAICGLVLRLANGFGAPLHPQVNRWTLLVNDLCRQAATSGKLKLQTPGTQERNFMTLSDIVQVVIHFLRLPPAEYGDGLFNVGSARSMTILEMANLIASRCAQVLNITPPILAPSPGPETRAEPLDYCIDKLNRVGFVPQDDYAAEIDATIGLCREAFGTPGACSRGAG
jgi:UDP-glucose 4-epimerase